jgi:antitoxin VapB
MTTAKVFMSGRSQAVRLPRAFRFDTAEVYIRRTPEGVLLVPKHGQRLGEELAAAFAQIDADMPPALGGATTPEAPFERPEQGSLERTLADLALDDASGSGPA